MVIQHVFKIRPTYYDRYVHPDLDFFRNYTFLHHWCNRSFAMVAWENIVRPVYPNLYEWQFIHGLGRDPYKWHGWCLTIGLVRFTSFPMLGFKFGREHHDGIAITIYFRLPVRTYRNWYIKLFGREWKITYPIRLNLKHIFDSVEVW